MQTKNVPKPLSTNELKEEFQLTISRFSHEIRNPVSLIGTELQMIASANPEVTACEYWDDVMENLSYVRELLDELSIYNQADRLRLTAVPLTEYLQGILSCVRPTLEYLGISLLCEIDEDLPFLSIDRVKLRQAVLNLIRNAQESISHSHGKIVFRAQKQKSGICISVQDNGCGMTPEQTSQIFTPFTTFKEQGTGLGLSVTRQIIEAHGGTIWVSSSPGHGSVFKIFLDDKAAAPE